LRQQIPPRPRVHGGEGSVDAGFRGEKRASNLVCSPRDTEIEITRRGCNPFARLIVLAACFPDIPQERCDERSERFQRRFAAGDPFAWSLDLDDPDRSSLEHEGEDGQLASPRREGDVAEGLRLEGRTDLGRPIP
jgi:hypothetical protein